MPTFCRHNHLVQNCPICAREQDVEMRPVVSPGGHTVRPGRPPAGAGGGADGHTSTRARSAGGRGSQRVTVRRLSRGAEDGFRSPLAPGLRSGADAQRLAGELAFAATRLARLAEDPPGLYAEVADPGGDVEERSWLAFLIAYLGPLDGETPFAGIEQARTTWSSGQPPAVDDVPTGPRTAHEPGRGLRTIDAYLAWAGRAGSQASAYTGEAAWAPDRRFARAFERLALPGLHRGARFDLLASLGQTGVYELSASALGLGGNDPVTLAAKRVLGIGDPMLLERRAAELAQACGVPLAALDLGLFNWERGERASLGMGPADGPDPDLLATTEQALGL
ncbi:MAG TPA: hypothetical protein VHX62_09155 [Solirubrobacteraceae bacterium]|jgi:hypothetical protein|nr:hypothetical protein [Solirubrobacteraceae bacterium]